MIIAAFVAAAGACMLGCSKSGNSHGGSEADGAPPVTAVEGPSWLAHLGISNSMGRLGGAVASPESTGEATDIGGNAGGGSTSSAIGMARTMRKIYSAFRANRADVAPLTREEFTISGSDLYRLNCQACHGPNGEGSPPTVSSLVGPVQRSSAAFERQWMANIGTPVSDELASRLAASADSALRYRLSNGGAQMPPFRHLRGEEVASLLQYLRDLAGVPDSTGGESRVSQSVARVGEQIVKGTCHICHDATGPPTGGMSMAGSIPSLASMPGEHSLQDVVRQIRQGSSSVTLLKAGLAMPAFPYISEDEAASVYFYLLAYPPQPSR